MKEFKTETGEHPPPAQNIQQNDSILILFRKCTIGRTDIFAEWREHSQYKLDEMVKKLDMLSTQLSTLESTSGNLSKVAADLDAVIETAEQMRGHGPVTIVIQFMVDGEALNSFPLGTFEKLSGNAVPFQSGVVLLSRKPIVDFLTVSASITEIPLSKKWIEKILELLALAQKDLPSIPISPPGPNPLISASLGLIADILAIIAAFSTDRVWLNGAKSFLLFDLEEPNRLKTGWMDIQGVDGTLLRLEIVKLGPKPPS